MQKLSIPCGWMWECTHTRFINNIEMLTRESNEWLSDDFQTVAYNDLTFDRIEHTHIHYYYKNWAKSVFVG